MNILLVSCDIFFKLFIDIVIIGCGSVWCVILVVVSNVKIFFIDCGIIVILVILVL